MASCSTRNGYVFTNGMTKKDLVVQQMAIKNSFGKYFTVRNMETIGGVQGKGC